jgi:hypothetical protein
MTIALARDGTYLTEYGRKQDELIARTFRVGNVNDRSNGVVQGLFYLSNALYEELREDATDLLSRHVECASLDTSVRIVSSYLGLQKGRLVLSDRTQFRIFEIAFSSAFSRLPSVPHFSLAIKTYTQKKRFINTVEIYNRMPQNND